MIASLALAAICATATSGTQLENETIRLKLAADANGAPLIAEARWAKSDKPIFTNISLPQSLSAWVPRDLLPEDPAKGKTAGWCLEKHLSRARFSRTLVDGLEITWIVQLPTKGPLVRMHVRLANAGTKPKPVEWFPAWSAVWKLAERPKRLRYWKSLSFRPVRTLLTGGREIRLGSRLHSSDRDDNGVNPYWLVTAATSRLYFSLDWCGGWEATLAGDREQLAFSVRLPPRETQLVLQPGQAVAGPVLTLTAIPDSDDRTARAAWMRQRARLAQKLYTAPAPAYPLVYNHWYATRFALDADFLNRQVHAMDPYSFDAFVVDAGWYEKVGAWRPHPEKFKPGQFQQILQSAKKKCSKVGIWTCPQFVNAPADQLPPEVDWPGKYEKFIDGHLLDLDGCNFTERLCDHVAMLRKDYAADWWKYDQLLFTEKTRAGAMKNVIAFRNALLAVRRLHPDLVIENCQSGGRMINELTLLATQTQWLKDGGDNGLQHARSNIEVALGAIEFVFPWAASRWTNNFDRMDPTDDELTRYYCRSAMAGTWGIVADLSKIEDHQRSVILEEIKNYRRLNQFKPAYLYDLILPEKKHHVAGAVFYHANGKSAAVLLYRWDRKGPFTHFRALDLLPPNLTYTVEDVDRKQITKIEGRQLHTQSLNVTFSPQRRSALVFVEPAP